MEELLKYIEKEIMLVDSFLLANNEYQKIKKYLEINNITIDYNSANYLLKNSSKLRGIIQQYINYYKELLPYFNIEELITDNNLITFISTFSSYEQDDVLSSDYSFDSIPILTKEQEQFLALKMQSGDLEARKILIESNLKYVNTIAIKYQNKGLSLEDLIQEGNIGLIEAIDRYVPNKDCRIVTYATSWIRKEILRAIHDRGKLIRIPVYTIEKLRNFIISKNNYENVMGREATPEELSEELNIDINRVKKYLMLLEQGRTISLSYLIDDEKELQETIPNLEISLEEEIITKEMSRYIYNLLYNGKLSEMEIKVVILMNGLFSKPRLGYSGIAKMYGKTKQYVYYVYHKALEKIRLSHEVISLAGFMDDEDKALQYIKDYSLKKRKK